MVLTSLLQLPTEACNMTSHNHNKPQGHFQTHGAEYATFRPRYPDTLAKVLADCVSAHQVAVDVGCGTGQLTRLLATHFDKVLGTDISQSQLANAPQLGNVEYQQQAAELIPLADASVDLITAAQAVHWFDLERFYQEVGRVLKPDGVLALITYGVPIIDDSIKGIFQQGYWQSTHHFWPKERAHVEDGYTSLAFPFSPMSLPQQRYVRDLSIDEFIGYMQTWSAYKAAVKQSEEGVFNAFFDRLRRVWPQGECKPVVWPIVVKAARVHQA